MSAGICPTCKGEYKNVEVHSRYCKQKPSINKVLDNNPDIKEAMKQESILQPPTILPPPVEPSISIQNKLPWYKRLFAKKQPKEKRKVTITEMFDSLPKWSIKQKKPWGSPKNKTATWIQIVAFSRTRAPKAVWAEYDGVSISIDDMFFPAPSEIRGEIFPYDMDKGVPLLDNSKEFNNMSYWNKLVERVKNMYFTLGFVSGSGDFTKNIGLILMLVGVCILAVIINIIITYGLTKDFAIAAGQIGNTTAAVQNYINTHP